MSTQLDLTKIRRAVAEQIRNGTQTTIRAYAYRPLAPQFPAAIVGPAPDEYVAYHATFGDGVKDLGLVVQLLAQRGDDGRSGDERIDSMMSTGVGAVDSVIDALERDLTLGGAVDNCIVTVGRDTGVGTWPETTIAVSSAELHLSIRIKQS